MSKEAKKRVYVTKVRNYFDLNLGNGDYRKGLAKDTVGSILTEISIKGKLPVKLDFSGGVRPDDKTYFLGCINCK